jgi:hypothetical protein
MTADEVKEIIEIQKQGDSGSKNDHGIALQQALVPPQKITIIVREVRQGEIKESKEEVWLVGRENSENGYRIIMREDGLQFGLASPGLPQDKFPVFVGWYGALASAFLCM